MKVRQDFVTNSSSSSFIISTKDIDYDFLINTVLKDFHLAFMRKWYDETDEEILSWYNPEKVLNDEDGNFGVFIKTKKEIDDEKDDGYWHYKKEDKENEEDLEEYYVIDNNCTSRFNWDIVEEVLTNKYNIPWKYGYCD